MTRVSSTCLMLCALTAFAVLFAVGMLALPAPLQRTVSRLEHVSRLTAARLAGGVRQLAQNEDEGGAAPQSGVSPEQLQRYVAVYRAMQHNHGLTIEKAAAAQGLSVPAFRDLEQRIESDELARDDARRALAAPAGQATSQPQP